MTSADRARSEQLQELLFGGAGIGSPVAGEPAAAGDLRELLVRHSFDESWSRPGLPVRDKCLVTVALLAAGGSERQLRKHLEGARRAGVTDDELCELLIHVAAYAGVARASEAFRILREIWVDQASPVRGSLD